MRVLFIIVSKNKSSAQNTVTGPERRMANIASLWKNFDVEPVVCYPENGSLKKVFINAGSTVISFQIKGKFDYKSIQQIRKIIRNNNIDLVHTQGAAATDLIATLAAKKAKVPIVITRPVMIEDQVHYSAYKKSLYEWIDERITLKKADTIIAVSQNGFDTLQNKYGVNSNKLKLVYNGIDLDKFSFQHRPARKPVIGMVAHFSVFKGWFDFISIIELLHKKGLEFHAHIIGDGELKQQMLDEVAKRNLSGIISFKGNVNNVNECLINMDIFLFTSHREGLSVAIIEALASGLPIVASDVGGIREQVYHKENGFIFNKTDIQQMADAVSILINDEELRKRMGEKSRSIAIEKFSQQRMISSYVNIYRQLIKKNAAAVAS